MAKEEKKKVDKKGQKSWFQGLKAEYNKIVWTDKNTLVKQTGVVVTVTAMLCVLISIMDAVILQGVNFLVR